MKKIQNIKLFSGWLLCLLNSIWNIFSWQINLEIWSGWDSRSIKLSKYDFVWFPLFYFVQFLHATVDISLQEWVLQGFPHFVLYCWSVTSRCQTMIRKRRESILDVAPFRCLFCGVAPLHCNDCSFEDKGHWQSYFGFFTFLAIIFLNFPITLELDIVFLVKIRNKG